MSSDILSQKVYCPRCKHQHEAPACIPLQKAFFAASAVLTLLVFFVMPARAAINDVALTRLADEVIDTNGAGVTNAVFYLDCDGSQLTVTLEIEFSDGAVQLRTGDNWCGAKFYIEGFIRLATVVAVVAEPPTAVNFVYIPMVER